MSLLDSVTEPYFARTEKGTTVFYPWGFMGRGYEIPTPEKELSLRSKLKSALIGLFLVVFASLQFSDNLNGVLLTGVGIMTYAMWVNTVTRGLRTMPWKQSFSSRIDSSARTDSLAKLITMTILSLLLCLASAAMFFIEPDERFWGAAGFLLFGLTTAVLGYTSVVKFGNRRK